MHSSFNCMNLILEQYRKKQCKSINFVELITSALSTYKSPDYIIFKLFNFLVEDQTVITKEDRLKILWGLCTSESLVDEQCESDVTSIVDVLLSNIEFIPLMFVKVAVKQNKLGVLTRIISHLSQIIDNKWLCSTNTAPTDLQTNYPDDQAILLTFVINSNNNILKLLLEETNLDVMEKLQSGDTCIHLACRQ